MENEWPSFVTDLKEAGKNADASESELSELLAARTDKVELLPCPFCGGSAKIFGGLEAQEALSIWCENGHNFGGFGGNSFNKKLLISQWNTRGGVKNGNL